MKGFLNQAVTARKKAPLISRGLLPMGSLLN
jgi:hypothetical protein